MLRHESTETEFHKTNGQEARGLVDSHQWKVVLHNRLGQFGHRNWVVVADSAYPLQASAGVETLVTGCGHLDAVAEVLDQIRLAPHISPSIYLDCELPFVSDEDAPGVQEFRDSLARLVGSYNSTELLHEQIIAKLHDAAQMFRVLVIKTDGTIPYTSVFVELECQYWSKSNEARLRAMME